MPYLVVENGECRGDKVEIQPGVTITFGRDQRADITVTDHICSRRHFEVAETGGKFVLKDLGSSNGTFLNEVRVEGEPELSHGDCLRAGETQLTFLDDGGSGGRGLVGKTVGGYRILERIGRGGMGTVYKALQVSLNRVVALKILSHKVSAKDPAFIERFTKEAQAAGRLNHPNIVQVYDVGSDRDLHFYSMEFIENGSVQDMLNRDGALDVELALAIITDAARGLEYAEKKRLVHQDIKPDNLMINAEGVVKIADLGLARDAGEGASNGSDEGIFGTPHFISPEQAQGLRVDTRSDIYSLGASFYRLVTGRTPFEGDSIREIITKQIHDEPVPVREVTKSCPAGIAQLVEKMMRKDADERPATAASLVDDLEHLGTTLEGGQKKPLLIAAGLAVIALGVAAFFIFGSNGKGEKPTPPPKPKPPIRQPDPPTPVVSKELEQRRADAINAYTQARLDEGNLVGDLRSLEALRGARDRYQKILDDYGDDDPQIASVRTKVSEQLTRVKGEITKLEADAAAREAEASRIKAAAKTRADKALADVKAEVTKDRFSGAVRIVLDALAAPELKGTPHLAALRARVPDLHSEGEARVDALLASADAKVQTGDHEGAAEGLVAAAKTFRDGGGSELEFVPVQELAERLDTRARAIRTALAQKLAADRMHDERVGFQARKQTYDLISRSFDLAAATASLKTARDQLRTPPWQELLDRDLEDLAAAGRVLSRLQDAVKKRGQGKLEIKLPNRKGNRLISWRLLSIDGTSMRVERRPSKKTIKLAEHAPARLWEYVFERNLPDDDEARADAARLLVLAGSPELAVALLETPSGDGTQHAALLTRARSETAAKEALAQIRELEQRARTDGKRYLELLPAIDAFLERHRGTVAFARASDGTTPALRSPQAP